MKTARYILLLLLAGCLLFSTAMAGKKDKKKKLPVGSYITSAKIEILSGKKDRIEGALVHLHDLAGFYGPHSEAYYWTSQIYVDYIEKASSGADKMPHIKNFLLYADSLKFTCDNKDIKKKYRKNCDKLSEKCDSIKVIFWREYYNYGVEKLDDITETTTDMNDDPDSASQAYYQEKISSIRDTAQAYFELSLAIDSTDPKGWLGISQLYSQTGDLPKSNEMLKKALVYSPEEDIPGLQVEIANNYINNRQYCEAIPHLKVYVDGAGSENTDIMETMGAIYYACDKADSAYNIYKRMIAIDSTHLVALGRAGRYHRDKAMQALDSTRHYSAAEDQAGVDKWSEVRQAESLDAKKYLERAFRFSDETEGPIAGEYGLVLYLLGDYEAAIEPFSRLVKIDPKDKASWNTLGDCYLKMQDFAKSAEAYEHVVELSPDNRPVWESLEALYLELKMPEKRKEAQSHLN